jgi:hypothetical protein
MEIVQAGDRLLLRERAPVLKLAPEPLNALSFPEAIQLAALLCGVR